MPKEMLIPQMRLASQERYVEEDTASLISFSETEMQKSLQESIPPQSPDAQGMITKVKTGKSNHMTNHNYFDSISVINPFDHKLFVCFVRAFFLIKLQLLSRQFH